MRFVGNGFKPVSAAAQTLDRLTAKRRKQAAMSDATQPIHDSNSSHQKTDT
jgi:hypothetical protein